MRGEFEINKSAYPYAAVMHGEHWYITHVPTLWKWYAHPVPKVVGDVVAAKLNGLAHGSPADREALKKINDVGQAHMIRNLARVEFSSGTLPHAEYQGLLEKL